jgi:hypothetical protein
MSPAARNILRYQRGSSIGLCELLFLYNLHVTEPQDKLYALMHIAWDYNHGDITVDYGKTSLEVMIEAAAYHIRVHRNLRFLDATYLKASENGDEDENEDLHLLKPTWLPQGWLGNYNRLGSRAFFVPRTTKCRPDAVAIADHRLQLRGMRIDYLRSRSIYHFYKSDVTPRQFWSSSLGLYLRVYAGIGMTKLPDEAFRTLFAPSNYYLEEFTTQVRDTHASKNDLFQNYRWGDDEDSDQRMLITLREAAILALNMLLQLSQDSRYADQVVLDAGRITPVFRDRVDSTVHTAWKQLFTDNGFDLMIMTETKKLGRIPDCDFEGGDEIWMVLGIDEPLVLRPQPNGSYWHICAAEIPALQRHKDIRNFSSDIQPGDKIGDWVVEDIEIE